MQTNLNRFLTEYTQPISTVKKILYHVVPAVFAIARASPSIYLAYQFGSQESEKVFKENNSTLASTVIGVSFATISAIPLTALSYKVSMGALDNLIISYKYNYIFQTTKCSILYDVLLWGLSFSCSMNNFFIPQYLFQDHIGDYVYLVSIPAYISGVFQTKWGLDKLTQISLDTLVTFNILSRSSFLQEYKMVNDALSKAASFVTNIPADTTINTPLLELTGQEVANIQVPGCKKFIGYTSFIIGFFAPFVIQPVTEKAYDKDLHTNKAFSLPMSIISYLSVAVVSGYSGKATIDGLYDAFQHSPCSLKGCGITSLKLFTVLVSSTYRTQLTIDFVDIKEFYGPPLLAAVTFSCTTTDYWAIDKLFNSNNNIKYKLSSIIKVIECLSYKIPEEIVETIEQDTFPLIQNLIASSSIEHVIE